MDHRWQYYDLVLIAVAVSMVGGVAVGLATEVTLQTSVALAGIVDVAIICHGLFVNGPIDPVNDPTEEADALGPA